MPEYTFRRNWNPTQVKTFRCPVDEYDRMKAALEGIGWERVFDLPSTVCVYKGYHELEQESYDEMKKNDRDGWAGSVAS